MRAFASSFRGRLTLLSLLTLAVALTAYSLLLGQINLSRLSQHIDEDLQSRARMLSHRTEPPPRGQGPFDQPRPEGGPAEGRGGDPPGDRPPQDRRPPPGGPVDMRAVRMIDSSGRVVGGQGNDQMFDEPLFERALGGQEGFAEIVLNGAPVRVFATPWMREGGPGGAIEVAHDLRDYQDMKSTQIWTWLALAPLALAISAVAAFLMTGRALTPLREMQKAAATMGQGDLSQRLQITGDDELAHLAQAFNVMAANLQKAFEDQAAAYESLKEAYESQRRFTADASHELRTPLSRLQLATSSALRGPESGYKGALETADSAAKSMAKLTRELLVLARADAGQLGLRHEIFDLRLAVSNALNGFNREIGAHFPPGPVLVEGDQDHLERVISNLIDNAVRHTPETKPITVTLSESKGGAVITVEDKGEGIAPEHLPHLFERFYRVDPARARADGGVGLGLAICKSLIEAHGGSIAVASEAGQGTTVKVTLPVAATTR